MDVVFPKKIGKIQKIRPNRPQIHPKSTLQPSQDRSKIASGGHLGCLSVWGRFFLQIGPDLTAEDRPKLGQEAAKMRRDGRDEAEQAEEQQPSNTGRQT